MSTPPPQPAANTASPASNQMQQTKPSVPAGQAQGNSAQGNAVKGNTPQAVVAPSAGLPQKRKPVGEILITHGAITEAILNNALAEGKQAHLPVGYVLVKNKSISIEQLGKALSEHFNLRYFNLESTPVPEAMLTILPSEMMQNRGVVPVAREGGRLYVAMVNPTDRSIIDEITFITGIRPTPLITTHFEFENFSKKYFSSQADAEVIEQMLHEADMGNDLNNAEVMRQQRDAELSDMSNPIVKLVNTIIEQAIDRNASDIHIEPRKTKYVVRYRKDGILIPVIDIPKNMELTFVTRLKVMARLDIAEHRRPQDGRFALKYRNAEFNLRVNTLPTSDGREKVVMRILRPASGAMDFLSQGMALDDVKKMEYLYHKPHGILLVAGPTGSGKTTTLYTILNKINDDDINISTVEDPVELSIEGLNQTQVNAKIEFNFAASIRALMRQDPDVIMIGEIRDSETLAAAIQAALTGHLVLSTIHSNTAVATISRLHQMGAENYLVASALNGVVSQRLMRKVCPECFDMKPATAEEKALLLVPVEEELDVVVAKGCPKCNETGYQGRTGLFEIMVVDRELRDLISKQASDLQLEDVALNSGMKTLLQSAREKVLMNVTTMSELRRVLGD
jgi:type IV pilus assembly protein PilB